MPISTQADDLLAQIRQIILASHNMPEKDIAGARFIYRDDIGVTRHCFERPLAALTAQGNKAIHTGRREFVLRPGSLIVSSMDMPSTSALINADPPQPYLGLAIDLDHKMLADIIMELPKNIICGDSPGACAWMEEAAPAVMDAFLRLAKIMAAPEHAPILAPLVLRELHYLLLMSPAGVCLRNMHMGGQDTPVVDVITWLRHNPGVNISLREMAARAHMSISSFHRHFKTLTGYTPLQYHKQMRLHEARRLMLAENMRVADTALQVGYESVTQFNREYRRLFGEPPRRDISRIKGRINWQE